MSYYKAHFAILKKTPKYSLYMSHFDNLPVGDVDFECKKQSDDVYNLYLYGDTIEAFNEALNWLEESIGLEPFKTEWIEEK